MQSSKRSHVIVARLLLALVLYVPLVVILRGEGRDWYHALFTPAVHLTLGYTFGSIIAILMMAAAGWPLPWTSGRDDA